MPATLNEAFRSPFHNNVYAPSSTTSSSMDSIKNPAFQSNYKISSNRSASDIESEAEEVRSIYEQKPSSQAASIQLNRSSGSPVAGSFSSSDSSNDSLPKVHEDIDSNHECNMLIARLLACARCRKRLRELLVDDDVKTNDDAPEAEQTGGGSGFSINGFLTAEVRELISNILLGLFAIIVLEWVLKK